MRESNYTFPPSNRAVISINQMLYDRRALDTNSTLALLNNLCQLTYLTSTSPRIREVLTMDGGLERMLDILRDSCLPHEPTMPDLWGLNGPCTARTIIVDRAISLRHSLAFQCVVNIGVRGNETIRTRVVQAGALDIVAQILESWLKKNGIAIFSSSLGSQAAVDALAAGIPLPGVEARRRRQGSSRSHHHRSTGITATASAGTGDQHATTQLAAIQQRADRADASHPSHGNGNSHNLGRGGATSAPTVTTAPSQPQSLPAHRPPPSQTHNQQPLIHHPSVPNTTTTSPNAAASFASSPPNVGASRALGQFMATLITNRLQNRVANDHQPPLTRPPQRPPPVSSMADTDVDMADAETEGGETDTGTDMGADTSMDVEYTPDSGDNTAGPSQVTTTPRARLPLLPMAIPRRSPPDTNNESQASSNATSLSGDEPTAIPRARSDNSLAIANAVAAAEAARPASGMGPRLSQLSTEAVSTQSSPVGSPADHAGGLRGRRGTIVGRPRLLPGRIEAQRRQDESEVSDGVIEPDLAQATITAGIAAAAANAAMEAATAVPNQPADAPQPAIVGGNGAIPPEEPDPEILAAEQARFDMEAGAPPGRNTGQTPNVTTDVPLPPTTNVDMTTVQVPTVPTAQIIIANGAPRGFQDLASYVGVSMLLNPEGTNYSEDNILLALQLLAYLSKYAHVRNAFHHPRRPMHRTFDLGADGDVPLPQRPAYSETPNIFSLVERFTFRPSPSDPLMFRIPNDIQYWAGVIMRNACRKDDAQGGIRQCAYMSCGRWEQFPREFAKCRRCRKAKYCSKECQSKAWNEGHRFWCSVRSEPEPNADGAHRSEAGGGGDGSSHDRGERDRRRERERRHTEEDDEDVDMNGGGDRGTTGTTGSVTVRAVAAHPAGHTPSPPRPLTSVPAAAHGPLPTGASMPTSLHLPRLPRYNLDFLAPPAPSSGSTTPRASTHSPPAPFFSTHAPDVDTAQPAASSSRESTPTQTIADALPDAHAPPPAPRLTPRAVPAFLKLGRPGGPSSTAELNAAMNGTSRRRNI